MLLRRRATPPPPGVHTDWQILCELAERLGCGHHFRFTEPRAIFEELRRASAGGLADYNGISYEKITGQDGVFWPCPSAEHPGTPRLFADRFATADGRALPRGALCSTSGRAGCRLPALSDDGPRHRPLPVRHTDPPHRCAAGSGAGALR